MGNRENEKEIMPSVLKLMRAMRRYPMERGHGFPPSVERMLMILNANDGASPAMLCELLDVRPSSMSELLGRMEKHDLITRTENEEDRRATKIFLSEKGKASVEMIEEKAAENNARLAGCFTDEELAQFCALCDRLSGHLESLYNEEQPGHHGPRGHRGHCGPGHHGLCHHGPFVPCRHHGHHGGFCKPEHHRGCFKTDHI